MIVLIHDVVHYNKSAACFLTVQRADNKEAYRHSDDSYCLQYGYNDRIEKCPLGNLYIRPDGGKSLVELSLDLSLYNDDQYPASFSVNSITEIPGLKYLSFRQKTFSTPCNTDHISSSSGLRAPPYTLI